MPISSNFDTTTMLPNKGAPEVGKTKLTYLEKLKVLFPDLSENRLKQIINEEEADPVRPAKWSLRTNAPYYKQRYALQLKQVLDEMIEEYGKGIFENRVYKYSAYCEGSGSISKDTLYLQLNQAKKFLLEVLDPEYKYATFFEIVQFYRKRSYGVVIAYNRDCIDGKILSPSRLISEDEERVLKLNEEISHFIETAKDNEKFERQNLILTPVNRREIEESLSSLGNFVTLITDSSVKIIKLSDDEALKLK